MDTQTASLWTNIALAAITMAYALLTWRLAKSSASAARSATESAAAAADSARLQQAALEAQAAQRHAWFKTAGGGDFRAWEIGVIPLLGTYWVHEVELIDFHLASEIDGESSQTITIGQVMTPIAGTLPARVDEVEGVRFTFDLEGPANAAFGHSHWRIMNWRCLVTFSLAESDQSRRRLVVHLDPKMDPRVHWLRQARELGFER